MYTTEDGAVVSALQFQARNPERVNVYLDGQFAFGLEATRAAALRIGQRLSTREIADLRAEDEIALTMRRALRFLSYRPRSVAEVRRHLQKRPLAEEIREAALQRLSEGGYLDDGAFARFWVENRATFRPASRRALRHELRQKGVENEIIDAELEGWDDTKAALAALHANGRRWARLDESTFRQQAGAFLQRRGFHYQDAEEALRIFQQEWAATDAETANPASQYTPTQFPNLAIDPRKE